MRDGPLGEVRALEQRLEDADPAGGAEAARQARSTASRETDAWLEARMEGLCTERDALRRAPAPWADRHVPSAAGTRRALA